MFLIVNKFHEKAKTNNELILLTSVVSVAKVLFRRAIDLNHWLKTKISYKQQRPSAF